MVSCLDCKIHYLSDSDHTIVIKFVVVGNFISVKTMVLQCGKKRLQKDIRPK